MKTYYFKGLLQNNGWVENIQLTTDLKGIISDISTYEPSDTNLDTIHGYAIPGFQNAHSHAFQYAMAGLAEKHSSILGQDDFWGWREAMYQLALSMNPAQMQAIATMLYSEMVRHGYTNVAEFHYVHHDQNGKSYANLAEMGSSLIAAAKTAGIGITLIPIFYQKGGFGQQPTDNQRRFISPSIDNYLELLDASSEACKYYEHANIGIGIHSMRGVEPLDIVEIAKSGPQNIPFHIHVSEQLKEIEDSIKYLGERPVKWLSDHIDLNQRFHLVHATHMTITETETLARSNANVVLCPSTEGNLGDGIFPLRKYQEAGGHWSIGTDSHIGLNPMEELRILDYGQRLTSHKRDTYSTAQDIDSGQFAIQMATVNGRKAMGNFNSDFFKIGEPINACVFDQSHPLLEATSFKNLSSTLLYATDASMQTHTISNGILHTNRRTHNDESDVRNNFTKALKELKNR